MRRPALAALLLLAAAGCPSSSSAPAPAGKRVGETCASRSECAAGLLCFASRCAVSYDAAATCAPPGPAATLADGGPVGPPDDPAPDQCVTYERSPVFPAADGTIIDLGSPPVGTSVSFDVPPGTTGFSIVSQALSGPISIVHKGLTLPNTPVPTDLKTPGGALFYSDTAATPTDARGYYDPTGTLAWYLGYGPVTGVFTVPNTSAALDLVRSAGEVPPGTWTFTVNDWARECLDLQDCSGGSADSVYRVHVLTHAGAPTAPALRSTGTLDLEIYLATSQDTFSSAAAAAADPHVARFVSTLRTYYARAGICIANVTFHDLPDWAKLRYAPGGEVDIGKGPPCDALSQLFALAVGGSGPAVHLFLADRLVDGSGDTMSGYVTLGVDGAIPGPSGVPGTITGGAIVGLFDQLGFELAAGACSDPTPDPGRCGTDLVAYVAAHEAGHWLGLYHTTEATGDLFDSLTETATCPCLSCAPVYQRSACSELGAADSPTLMENRFCASVGVNCGGGRNLMFWLIDEQLSTGELTPEQGEVMRQNPAVR